MPFSHSRGRLGHTILVSTGIASRGYSNSDLALAGFGFDRSCGGVTRVAAWDDPHLLPVVGKFSPALKAYHICASRAGGGRAALSASAAHGEAEAIVPAAKQHVEDIQVRFS